MEDGAYSRGRCYCKCNCKKYKDRVMSEYALFHFLQTHPILIWLHMLLGYKTPVEKQRNQVHKELYQNQIVFDHLLKCQILLLVITHEYYSVLHHSLVLPPTNITWNMMPENRYGRYPEKEVLDSASWLFWSEQIPLWNMYTKL